MRDSHNVFHLAIPCRDLDETVAFYENGLGAKLCRRYEDRVTFNFFGDQLVCHLSPDHVDCDSELDPYPRHFGITFREEADFLAVVRRIESRGLKFFAPISSRFAGLPEEHQTFFLLDPSHNFLEFKFYRSPEMMY